MRARAERDRISRTGQVQRLSELGARVRAVSHAGILPLHADPPPVESVSRGLDARARARPRVVPSFVTSCEKAFTARERKVSPARWDRSFPFPRKGETDVTCSPSRRGRQRGRPPRPVPAETRCRFIQDSRGPVDATRIRTVVEFVDTKEMSSGPAAVIDARRARAPDLGGYASACSSCR